MTTVSYGMSVSLDGYINDADGGIDWHRVDEELHRHFNDLDREADCHVYGRGNYETMRYWEGVDEGSDVDGVMLEYASIWQEIPKYVVSRELDSIPAGYRLIGGDLESEFESLTNSYGGLIRVGGATLAGSLSRFGFIDEFRRYVVPVVLGGGTPYFTDDVGYLELDLIETYTFGNGVILERYGLS